MVASGSNDRSDGRLHRPRDRDERGRHLARLVGRGDARYFLLGVVRPSTVAPGGDRRSRRIAVGLQQVSPSAWNASGASTGGFGGFGAGGTLYDCAGKAAAMRSAG